MKLHLSAHCITVDISEHSSHFLHVSQTLSKNFSKSFWINETLINFPNHKELKKRKEFLTSLYYTCAFHSQTENLDFLHRLIALHDKPIKLIRKKSKPTASKPLYLSPLAQCYTLLGASLGESLESIRKKYLRLAKQYHPDSHSLCKNILMFQKIQEAYETIKLEITKKYAA
ncbi:MAG: DnaJ domain-containing protein [Sulfurospirillaceae bacterium]|nr:DnaJ domain-containing protein [Sulfurospirillaceae bacterium]